MAATDHPAPSQPSAFTLNLSTPLLNPIQNPTLTLLTESMFAEIDLDDFQLSGEDESSMGGGNRPDPKFGKPLVFAAGNAVDANDGLEAIQEALAETASECAAGGGAEPRIGQPGYEEFERKKKVGLALIC